MSALALGFVFSIMAMFHAGTTLPAGSAIRVQPDIFHGHPAVATLTVTELPFGLRALRLHPTLTRVVPSMMSPFSPLTGSSANGEARRC